MMPRRRPTAEQRERGHQAELAFSSWLEASGVPFFYVDQQTGSFAPQFKGKVKRPDYFIGQPLCGMIAAEVKSYTLFADSFLFEKAEQEKLTRFERAFGCAVILFIFPPNEAGSCFATPNKALVGCKLESIKQKRFYRLPATRCHRFALDKDHFERIWPGVSEPFDALGR